MNPIVLVLSLREASLVQSALLALTSGTSNFPELDSVISDLQTFVHRAENPDLYAHEDTRTDGEADADALASAGHGTDEDYRHDDHQYCDDQF